MNLLTAGWDMFLAFSHLIAAWGLGRILVKRWGNLACLLTGMAIFHHLAFFLGLMGMLQFPLLTTLWILAVLWGWKTLIKTWSEHRPVFQADWKALKNNAPWGWVFSGLMLLGLIPGALGAMAPAVAYDDLNYHLAVPMSMLNQGRMFPQFDLSHSFFPMMLELNGLWLLNLGSDSAPRLMNLGLAVAVCVGFLRRAMSVKEGSGLTAFLAAAWWCLMPLVVLEMQMLAVEIFLALCVLGVWTGLVRVLQKEENGLGLLALSTAAAIGQKYTALALLPLFLLGLVVWTRCHRKFPWLIVFLFLLVALPTYVRNGVWTGNPFYPFFGSHFSNQLFWNDHLVQTYEKALYDYGGLGHGLIYWARLPVDLLIRHEAFHGWYTFALPLAFLGLLAWKKTSLDARLAFGIFLYGAFVWFNGSQDVRHLLPFAPMVLYWAATSMAVLFQQIRLLWLAPGLMICLVHAAQAWTGQDSPWPKLAYLTTDSREDPRSKTLYQEENVPQISFFHEVCRTLYRPGIITVSGSPPSERKYGKTLLLDNLTITYGMTCPNQRELLPLERGHLFFQGYWDWWQMKDADQFLKLAQERQVQYLALRPQVRQSQEKFIPPTYRSILDEVTNRHARLLVSKNGYELWEIHFPHQATEFLKAD